MISCYLFTSRNAGQTELMFPSRRPIGAGFRKRDPKAPCPNSKRTTVWTQGVPLQSCLSDLFLYPGRKKAYTKALETQVLQSRSNEENLLHETRSLYEEVGRPKALLELNEAQPPQLADPSTTPKPQGPDVTLSFKHYHKQKRMAVSKLAMQDKLRPPWTIAPHAPHCKITRPPEPKSVEGRNRNQKNSGQS